MFYSPTRLRLQIRSRYYVLASRAKDLALVTAYLDMPAWIDFSVNPPLELDSTGLIMVGYIQLSCSRVTTLVFLKSITNWL